MRLASTGPTYETESADMKRCAFCLKAIGLVAYKRWGDLYFCSGAHLKNYCKERQQESQIANFHWWLIESRGAPSK